MTGHENVDHESVQRFRDVATQYCQLLNQPRASVQQLLESLERLLPELCAAVLDLPRVGDGGPDAPEFEHNTVWRPLFDSLGEFLGNSRYYRSVFDPTDLNDSDPPVIGDLADDLADIYCDLRCGLDPWDSADAPTREAIIWEWRFSYESHWGKHATEAALVVFALLGPARLGQPVGSEPASEDDV